MKKRINRIAAGGLVTCLLLATLPKGEAIAAEVRYDGAGRIETALKIAQSGWTTKANYAVLAAADDEYLIDSLLSAPLAKAYDAPILINFKGDKLDEKVLSQFKEWEVSKVFIVSGDKVLTKAIEEELKNNKIEVQRLGDNKKQKTALNIANALKEKTGRISKAFVVSENDANIVDSLTTASIAGIENMPILLSPKEEVPKDVKAFIEDSKIITTYLIGGPSLLSDKVMTSINAKRIYGQERYETNVKVIYEFLDSLKLDTVYAASGRNGHLVDALAGSVLAAKNSSPILLVDETLGSATRDFIKTKMKEENAIEIFGGIGAVSSIVENQMDAVKNGEEGGLLKINTAEPVSSTTVKVTLKRRPYAFSKESFIASDENGKTMDIDTVELDPQDTEKKTVFVKFKNGTESGKMYAINSVNFAGRERDKNKPSLLEIKSTDYDKLELIFSKPIRLSTLKLDIKEKYGSKDSLKVKDINYVQGDLSSVEITTKDQKGNTVYDVDLYGVGDFDENYMNRDNTITFIGTEKDTTTKLAVETVKAVDPRNVLITFNRRVDKNTIEGYNNYTVEEAFDSKASFNIVKARMAEMDDLETPDSESLKRSVVITLDKPMKDSTLYNVIVRGLQTNTGVSTDSNANSAKFIGIGPFTTKMDMTEEGNKVTVLSNKKIRVTFKRHMNKSLLSSSNFLITNVYKNNLPLEVKSVTVVNDRNVDIEIAPMLKEMYKLTVLNLKDIDNNEFDTEKRTKLFEGREESGQIKSIKSAVLQKDNISLILTFDNGVGKNALDVTNYKIDGGIGYPSKVEFVPNDINSVKLTIPRTVGGRMYKINVTKLESSDGETMAKEGVETSFVGSGVSGSSPIIQGIQALDKQTIKVYFDRPVKDQSMNGPGKVWDSATNRLIQGAIVLTGRTTKNLEYNNNSYVCASKEEESALIIRTSSQEFASYNADRNGDFEVTGRAVKNGEKIKFSYSSNDIEPIIIKDVQAINRKSIRVKFNQPVEIENNADFARIALNTRDADSLKGGNYSYVNNALRLLKPTPIDTTYTTYDFLVSGGSLGGTNYLVVNPNITSYVGSGVHDYTENSASGFVTLKDEDSSKSGIQQIREFSGSNEEPGVINNVPVSMKDSKTIEINFPEMMNITEGTSAYSVLDKRNYKLVDRDGTEIIPNFILIHACSTEYDKDTNKVRIVLKTLLPESKKGYCLQFAKTLENALSTRNVRISPYNENDLKTEFALSTKPAEALKLSPDTSYNSETRTLKIKLNEKAISTTTYDKLLLMADFKITVVDNDGQEYILRESDIYNVTTTITDSYSNASDTINLVLKEKINGSKTLKSGAVGKIELVNGSTLRSINGENSINSNCVFVH